MSPFIVAVAVFLAVTATVAAGAIWFQGSAETKVEDRLALLTGAKIAGGGKDNLLKDSGVLIHPLDATQNILSAFLGRFRNLSLWFEQADVKFSPAKFFGVCALLAFAGGLTAVVAGLHPGFAPAIGLLCGMLPVGWLTFRRRRRFKIFGHQLIDALELMARALRSGHSLSAGFQLVAEEMVAPIATEFRRVFDEQNLGIPMDEALNNMTKRIPNLDLKFFATALILQRQTGGDLAEILDKISRLIRERFAIWGQVQALTGEGRLSGIVLLALPPCLFIAVYKMNPEYMAPMFTDTMGKQMLAGATIMQFLGALVIKKIVNIKV
jgi:tight adherence protein B